MINRRDFLKTGAGLGIIAGLGFLPYRLLANTDDDRIIITILSTNDMHSRIDPFPSNDKKYPNMGGMARRASLINSIRQEGNQVLVLDAGDIFQGTPYYNVYKGELELKLMNMIGYDASTLGNHEFDDGLENLKKQIPKANFPFICSNYDFSQTSLHQQTKPYEIFDKAGIKIGVYGLGIDPKGLISRKNYGDMVYIDPIEKAREMEQLLESKGCSIIIALSHLGHSYKSEKISDLKIAALTESTNLIIGGHTHTFLDRAVMVQNRKNKEVIVSQSGWGGINLGRTDLIFSKKFMQIVNAINTTKILKNQV
ncbi:MAG: metallophosphoesterase [Bacteroidales bacterium]|nr:metallophosphoesterase [Bacteroidales bacterium]